MNQTDNQNNQQQPKPERINHRGTRQVTVGEGDYIWLDRKRYGLRTHPSSDEEIEIIQVVEKEQR